MRILLLTHAFNSLTQRLGAELQKRGHEISIEFDIADSVAEEAVQLFKPELVVAPYLRRAIPESIWSKHVCLIVHPGVIGDRGPSALDWAIQEGEAEWGVTVLQAEAEMDAGPIWAEAGFRMRTAKKSSLYRNEVAQAAVTAVLQAVERFAAGGRAPTPLAACSDARGRLRPLMKQADRAIDWQRDDTATVLRKIDADYDPHDRLGAMTFLQKHAAKGQIVTGLLYVDPEADDLHAHLDTVETPLNVLDEKALCPGSTALEKINAGLR